MSPLLVLLNVIKTFYVVPLRNYRNAVAPPNADVFAARTAPRRLLRCAATLTSFAVLRCAQNAALGGRELFVVARPNALQNVVKAELLNCTLSTVHCKLKVLPEFSGEHLVLSSIISV